LNEREAAEYCGTPARRFPAVVDVRPVAMPDGRKLYDMQDLDHWIDGLKAGNSDDDDGILERLNR